MPRDEADEKPPITEPIIVDEILITGGHVEVSADIVRFTGWSEMQIPDTIAERRVIARLAMSIEVALELIEQFRRARQSLS